MKKLLIGGVVLGLLIVGAASASSLGTINQPTLASGSVTLNGCAASTSGITVQMSPQFIGGSGHPEGVQPVVSQITVTGLDPTSCDGKYLYGKFFDTNGQYTAASGSFFSSGSTTGNCNPQAWDASGASPYTISGGSVTIPICWTDAQYVEVQNIGGVTLVASNYSH